LKKMKLIKWTEQVQHRLKWKDIVEKAKTTRVVAPSKKKKCAINDTCPRIACSIRRKNYNLVEVVISDLCNQSKLKLRY
jgi:hypothetical protein